MLDVKLAAVLKARCDVVPGKSCGFSGRLPCSAQDGVDGEHADGAEHHHAHRVALPVHLRLLVDQEDAVDDALDGREDALRERAFALEDGMPCTRRAASSARG